MASVLFVSKPISPPWHDSGKNLVRDLARGMSRHQATVMVRRDEAPELGAARRLAVYGAARDAGFAPALTDQARVFAALMATRGPALWHFFFAPNAKSLAAGRLATRIRRVRSVHTISSAPRDVDAIVPQLFAEINVVLSRHTEARFRAAGLDASRIVRVAPAIEPLAPVRDPAARAATRASFGLPADRPCVVYPGDLEFGAGGALMVEALAQLPHATLVLACRAKTSAAQAAESTLLARARAGGLAERVVSVGETARIHALLSCADIVALPSADLYAKMDYPLVLLEAMSLERPVIVAAGSAAAELCDDDAARAVAPDARALAKVFSELLAQPAQAAALGERARRAVLSHYTHHAMARAYEDVYDRLLA